MDRLRGFMRRVRALIRPGAAERELRDEMRFHTDMETEQLLERGIEPKAARRSALIRFGGVDRYAEWAREERGMTWVEDARQDARLALRLLGRNPQFSLAVVLTLALGIGATTAVFSVVDAVLLRAWPFADVDRLVMVWETDRASGTSHEPASWPDVADMRERSRALSDIGSVVAAQGTLTSGGDPERVTLLAVTPNVPDLLGIRPLHGRTLRAGEGPLEGAAHALVSEPFWRQRFGGAPDIVGTSLMINGRAVEIVGVLPRDADLGIAQIHARADYSAQLAGDVDLWLAFEPTADAYPRQTHPLLTIGRLHPDASLERAQTELAGIMAELEQAYPENAARGVNLERYRDVTFGPVRAALFVLLGGVVLVLLVACVNVANLLLARTANRRREVAVRRALGASTSRMQRQFLLESVLLTLLGAAGGLLLAHVGVRVLAALAPPDIPRLANAALDVRVLAIATTASIVVCVLFGLAPVLEARRIDLQRVLKSQAGRTATDSRESRRFRDSLVIAQIALAVTLVVAAALLVRSFQTLSAVDPGFRTAGVLSAEYQLAPASRYPMDFSRWPELTEINTFHATFLERVAGLPGVEGAALAARSPLDPGITNSFTIIGREAESADFPEIRTRFITPGYLATLDVPLIAGRDLEAADIAGAQPVALINRAAARRYFDGSDPIDRQLSFWGTAWRIVGIMGDERFNGVDTAVEPAVYVPLAQAPQATASLLVRTRGDPTALIGAVRSTLRDIDPALALSSAETLDRTLAATVARPRFIAVLLGLFAGLALVLALIGVHGVLSYSVAQRIPEVGIRLALGSTRAGVMRLVLRHGLVLAAAGTLIGLAGAAVITRTMTSLLFGVQPHDAVTFAAVTAGTLTLCAIACLVPAARAARGHPMAALRSD